MYFKSAIRPNSDPTWSTYTRQLGWAESGAHLFSEGGTQVVQSLTQWSEDRSIDDRRAVGKVVVAHLVSVAAAISPVTVQSWAATRWASINTLFNYALDKILPVFGDAVAPAGVNATAVLLEGAHHMGRVGFDYQAYYSGHPNPRSANKSLPNGSVPVWNVYDHGNLHDLLVAVSQTSTNRAVSLRIQV